MYRVRGAGRHLIFFSVFGRAGKKNEGINMKRILILAVLLMMLATPVLADMGGDPNGNAWREPSVAGYVDFSAIITCGNFAGYSEIGECISEEGGYHGGHGLSMAAQILHGPALPP